jgi:hypothetical protein
MRTLLPKDHRGNRAIILRRYTMKPLLIATTNDGKLREIREILRGLAFPLHSLNDIPPIQEPAETGSTFSANALLKARAYARATGMVTVAEDSGLVVDALGGAPGIHSARYPGATYPEKFATLYTARSASCWWPTVRCPRWLATHSPPACWRPP